MRSIDSRWIRSAVTVFVALFFVSALPWRELRADAITHGEYDCSPLSVTYDQISSWDTTTQAEFTVANDSDVPVEGWTFELEFPIEVSVSNIWNAVDLTSEETHLVVGNQEYNSTIAPGESITFGIILEGTEFAPTAPSSVTLVIEAEEEITEISEEITDEPSEEPVEPDAFSYAVFTSGDISISGYMSNIYGDIYSGTNFIFQGSELNVEGTVRTAGSVNASGYITEIDSIEENAEFIDAPDLEEYIAEYSADKEILSSEAFISQTDIVADGYYYTEDSIEINAATLSGEAVIVAEEDITINVDTIPEGTNLILYSVNGDIMLNVTDAELKGILYAPEGTVTVNANEVSVIGNIVANELEFNGSILNISVDEDVVFPTVTPTDVPEITVTDTPTETPEPTAIPTEEPEVTDTPTPTVTVAPSLTETPTPTATATPTPTEEPVDTELDSDGDYIPDYLEVEIGTNPNNPDTDAEGLNDYLEIMVGYDPAKADTDDNGIADGDEDLDGDNVSNLVELSIGTEMMSEDTDCDGITDGNELYVYCSNPMNPDTDGDGIYDGDELLLGKSPTDSSDGDIRVEQTKEQEFSNEEDPAISSVEVTMELSNLIDRSLRIRDMYNVNVYVTNVAGRIGSPISFECAEEFDTATVVIHYDGTKLGDTQEEDLGVLWFDEANGIFVEQEQAVVDTDADTVTLELEHFSTYVVVDRSIRNSIRPTVYTIDEVSEPEEQHYDVIFAVNAHQGMTYDERVMAIQCIENVIGQLDEEDRYAFVLIGEGLVYSYYSFYSYGDGIPWKIRNDILRYSFDNNSPTYYRLACAGAHAVYENVPGSDVGNKTIILAITDEYISSTNVGSQYWLGHFITADWYTAFIPGTYCEDVAEDMYSHGGEWYSDCTKADIGAQIIGHEEAGIETISYVDEDEDGLPDVLEEEGMYDLNSDWVYYSNPTTPDSDMDTLTDGEEMGTMHRILRLDEDTVQIDRVNLLNIDEVGTSDFAYLESYIPENPNEICFVFDIVSDPMLKDTDGDGYQDGDYREYEPLVCNVIYHGIDLESYRFVSYNGSSYYGSSQTWFYDDDTYDDDHIENHSDDVIRDILGDDYDSQAERLFLFQEGGCGLISASDLLAYYSLSDSRLSSLYPYDNYEYNSNYYNYLMSVANYVSPVSLPFSVNVQFGGDTFYGTLGVTPTVYENGITSYCNSCGVAVTTHRAVVWNDDFIKGMIIEAYDSNCIPVLFTGRGVGIHYYKSINDFDGPDVEAIDYHWVNVLGFEENSIISESYVYVATWGGVRIIKLSEIVGICSDGRPNYMRGMMYYYECES